MLETDFLNGDWEDQEQLCCLKSKVIQDQHFGSAELRLIASFIRALATKITVHHHWFSWLFLFLLYRCRTGAYSWGQALLRRLTRGFGSKTGASFVLLLFSFLIHIWFEGSLHCSASFQEAVSQAAAVCLKLLLRLYKWRCFRAPKGGPSQHSKAGDQPDWQKVYLVLFVQQMRCPSTCTWSTCSKWKEWSTFCRGKNGLRRSNTNWTNCSLTMPWAMSRGYLDALNRYLGDVQNPQIVPSSTLSDVDTF